MAQAAEIISFPSRKVTIEPFELDFCTLISAYDDNRTFFSVAINVLGYRAPKLKHLVSYWKENQRADKMQRAFEALSKDYAVMSEMMNLAAERVRAARHNQI